MRLTRLSQPLHRQRGVPFRPWNRHPNTTPNGERLTRRRTITRLGGLLAASLGAAGLEAALSDPATGAGTGPAAVASGLVRCVLTPEQTEGPVLRRPRQGAPGHPGGTARHQLTLRTTVVDASTCKPVKGAAVDIWHCDATGNYSGVDGSSTTFLRGIQRTSASGLATFVTLFPGWYQGRTTHIHVKVHLGGNVVHTGQLYFPEAAVTASPNGRPTPHGARPRPATPTTRSIGTAARAR